MTCCAGAPKTDSAWRISHPRVKTCSVHPAPCPTSVNLQLSPYLLGGISPFCWTAPSPTSVHYGNCLALLDLSLLTTVDQSGCNWSSDSANWHLPRNFRILGRAELCCSVHVITGWRQLWGCAVPRSHCHFPQPCCVPALAWALSPSPALLSRVSSVSGLSPAGPVSPHGHMQRGSQQVAQDQGGWSTSEHPLPVSR